MYVNMRKKPAAREYILFLNSSKVSSSDKGTTNSASQCTFVSPPGGFLVFLCDTCMYSLGWVELGVGLGSDDNINT